MSVSCLDLPSLLVREPTGAYRPAQLDEVLRAAQQTLLGRVRGAEVMASTQAVRDFLAARLGCVHRRASTCPFLNGITPARHQGFCARRRSRMC
ncbi:hypothetical protein [Polaromonas hydrogenivorans]|uniref:Uncharacterized protein n=1 Tax=Polaromonas hydrogenivorans TaxID=335476 RepID=A0AAU7LYI6_9BURK